MAKSDQVRIHKRAAFGEAEGGALRISWEDLVHYAKLIEGHRKLLSAIGEL